MITSVSILQALPHIPENVNHIFTASCIKCHSGGLSGDEFNLRSENIHTHAINRLSGQKPELVIIKPGDPENSYLVLKIRNDPFIAGSAMPLDNEKLSERDIRIITDWISSLSEGTENGESVPNDRRAFIGWTIGNIPTAEVLDKGRILFSVKHRFAPRIEKQKNLFGIDGPAIILLSFGYAVTDELLVTIGRSNAFDDIELNARYRLFEDGNDTVPFSLAFQAALNWESREIPGEKRFRGNAFMYSFQVIATKLLFDRFSCAVVPGLLINPNTTDSGEEPLITIGLGGRYYIGNGYSLIADVVPIVSGFNAATSIYGMYDLVRRFDTWTFGGEKVIGNHVFQVLVTNSEGISTDQYLNGGDLDIRDGELRAGFTIYRIY